MFKLRSSFREHLLQTSYESLWVLHRYVRETFGPDIDLFMQDEDIVDSSIIDSFTYKHYPVSVLCHCIFD
jgi:hypothetical protein